MSGSDSMPPPALPLSSEASAFIKAVTAALQSRVPASRLEQAQAFTQAIYSRLQSQDYGMYTPEAWASRTVDLLEFVRQRRAGEGKLTVFNPQQEPNGWESSHTVLRIANDDMPFLVDSVSLALGQMGLGVHSLNHPIISLRRDFNGELQAVGPGGRLESLIMVEIDRQPADALAGIEQCLRQTLDQLRAVMRDQAAMRERLLTEAENLALTSRLLPLELSEREEARAFLHWLAQGNFVLLGYREYRVCERDGEDVLEAQPESGLGLLHERAPSPPRPVAQLGAYLLNEADAGETLVLTKANARSPVYRKGYMDYLGVLEFDGQGRIVSERRFLGLYAPAVYHSRLWDIPWVRRRCEHVISRAGLVPNGHSDKVLRHVLETLPREELFQSDRETLLRTASQARILHERIRSGVFLRRDRYGRFVSLLIYLPRERFSTQVRLRIEAELRAALDVDQMDASVHLDESPLAQLYLIVRLRHGRTDAIDAAALEARLAELLRNPQDGLRQILIGRHGEERGLQLARSYGPALPLEYLSHESADSLADDVQHLAALVAREDLRAALYLDATRIWHLKLYRQFEDIALSDALPVIENFGLRVLAERAHRLQVGEMSYALQDFAVEPSHLPDQTGCAAVANAFAQIWRGEAENDRFNRLILAAGLDWRQVAILRGYCKYLLQTGVPFSQAYVEGTLARYPLLARLLVEWFEARFNPSTGSESSDEIRLGQARLRTQLNALVRDDPAMLSMLAPVIAAREGKRQTQLDATYTVLLSLIDQVSSLDEDRILRSFISVIDATVRTNYYQRDAQGQPMHCISFKFDAARVLDLPKPRPHREIFVYGPRVEGVHLRFGAVARGGLRWSDRREDFRTEVLGLVKAQMVKNAVIIPVGAKGGFFVKRPPVTGGREALQAEGIACYKLFIQGLLDITDNIVEGRVVPPAQVVRHDEDDPYLVVAADKGTATFSDIANGLALDHGFWLGDAFASGGSVGYDHKRMGITARGAWESVKRHFRALGRDCQREDFTCIGVGDMSGDVFGNGMLLSRHTQLIAAFDHRHIFLDPDPDAASSFAERERLFQLPGSSWTDYDTAQISAGGGVYARTQKLIPLTRQVRAVLGLDESVESLAPNALISAILKAPVDLFWNGGIGTYVKASSETNAEVGDRTNNELRINGHELRCKVVGEGGNLGLTQLGRIEAAQAGVLLNTDFIDNSAGVDTSDHEVNIKILLNDVIQAKELDYEARNQLLASMTDEVAELVLRDNVYQNQALSLMERMSAKRLGSKQYFIRSLEQQGLLDRQIEFLPSDTELSARKARGQGLTRPELAVLLSYSKLAAYQQLLTSDIPEDPYLSKELQRYFPQVLRDKYADVMEQHRLKREIITTAVTNTTINRMGATFLMRMQEDTGRSMAEVAKAYTISRETLDARALWAQIEALDSQVSESVQVDALEVIWKLQRTIVRWLLLRPGAIPAIAAAVERYHGPFHDIRSASGVLPDALREIYQALVQQWQDKGMPALLAQQLAELQFLAPAFDIIELARARKLQPVEVSRVHFRLGDALHLPWLFKQIDALEVSGRWQAVARGVLRDELATHQRALVSQALSMPGQRAEDKVEQWISRDDAGLRFTLTMLQELAAQKNLDYPTVSVAVQRLGQLGTERERIAME